MKKQYLNWKRLNRKTKKEIATKVLAIRAFLRAEGSIIGSMDMTET